MSRLFPIIAVVVTLCIIVGVKFLCSIFGGARLNAYLNVPSLQLVGIVAASAIGIVESLRIINWLKRRKEACTDFTRAFDRKAEPSRPVPAAQEESMPEGVMLVPDAAVFEVAEIARRFELQDIRFETRQTVIDNAFHWHTPNGGLGTRMCVIVHPDDVSRAQPIVERVLNPPS